MTENASEDEIGPDEDGPKIEASAEIEALYAEQGILELIEGR